MGPCLQLAEKHFFCWITWVDESGCDRARPLPWSAGISSGSVRRYCDSSGTCAQGRLQSSANKQLVKDARLPSGGRGRRFKSSRKLLPGLRQAKVVAFWQDYHARIRRVSSHHCERSTQSAPPAHHASAANDCQAAKDELTKAQTDDAVELAVKNVRIFCED